MELNQFVKELENRFDKKGIVVFTGAGLSTASGLKDFRGKTGLYNDNIDAERILSLPFFKENPNEFYDFYREHLLIDDSIKPNLAHEMISDLEKEGIVSSVITQNIDGLHQRAGSKNVIEVHGNPGFYCMNCNKRYDSNYIKSTTGIPFCECGGIIRPDIVLYYEGLDDFKWRQAQDAITYAKTLLVIGSTLKVNPSSRLVHDFIVGCRTGRDKDKKLFIINMGPTDYDYYADYKYDGDVIEVAKKIKTLKKED